MARQVKIEILGDSRNLRRAFGEAERATSGFAKGIARAGTFAATGLAGIAAGVGVAAFKSIQAAQESNKISKETAALIKSTGGAAKLTTKQISDLATAISNKTGIDDEQVQAGENMLLTFRAVRNSAGKNNDIFTQSTSIIADMAVKFGTDMPQAAVQLGKALQDPIKGIGTLHRIGIDFNDQQKKQIKTMVESGNVMGAQKVILHELATEFGGVAASAATPLDRLKVIVGNLQEKIGNKLLPVVNQFADWVSNRVVPAAGKLVDQLGNHLNPAVDGFRHGIGVVQAFIKNDLAPQLDRLKKAWDDNKAAIIALINPTDALGTKMGTGKDRAGSLIDALVTLVTTAGNVARALHTTGDALNGAQKWLDRVATSLHERLRPALLAGSIAILDIGNSFLWVVEHTIGLFNKSIRDSAHNARKEIGDMRDKLNADLRSIINHKDITVAAQLKLTFSKSFTQADWAQVKVLTRGATGGLVRGPGGPTSDQVPALLSNGEFVVNAAAVRSIGVANMRHLNDMQFAAGGPVGTIDREARDINRLQGKGTGIWMDRGVTKMMAAFAALGAAGFGGGAASGNVIRLALAQARQMHASFKVALALIEAGIVESGLRNLPYGDRDSLGFLQQRPSQGWLHPMNISYAAWDFLRRAIPIAGRYGTAGQLAQAVQRSAFPGRYDQQQARALGILNAYGYDRGGMLPVGASVAINNTGRPEPVGAGVTINVNVAGSLVGGSPQQLALALEPHIRAAMTHNARLR